METKIEKFKKITDQMNDLYSKKNKDYGNSFGDSFNEFGIISAVVRITDKTNRIKTLVKNNNTNIKDESIKDTLLDLANYCVMTLVELNNG